MLRVLHAHLYIYVLEWPLLLFRVLLACISDAIFIAHLFCAHVLITVTAFAFSRDLLSGSTVTRFFWSCGSFGHVPFALGLGSDCE